MSLPLPRKTNARLRSVFTDWATFVANHPIATAAYTAAWFWTGAIVWTSL